MTTVTPERDIRSELAEVLGLLSQTQQGRDVVLNALQSMAADENPVFKVTPEGQAKRRALAATVVAASHRARAKLIEAGPSGTRAGQFIFDLARETGIGFELAFKVVSSLEVVGLARLEGSSILVSEELDQPQPGVDPANWTEVPERDPCQFIQALYDHAPPPAAKASTPTLSDQ